MKGNWDEAKHPRDEEGKFTDKKSGEVYKNIVQKLLKLSSERNERYERFIQEWAELCEKYGDKQFKPAAVFMHIDNDEVERLFGDEMTRWEFSLSHRQILALYNYTSKTDADINYFLRHNESGYDLRTTQFLRNQIDLISSALADFNLQHNIVVYRAQNELFNVGEEFTFKSFTSTSMSQEMLFGSQTAVQYEIEVPKGKGRGAYIKNHSGFPNEYEFLLQRDTKVKVIRKLEGGEFNIYRLRVID